MKRVEVSPLSRALPHLKKNLRDLPDTNDL